MVNIPLKSKQSFDRNSLGGMNQTSSHGIFTYQNITSINSASRNRQNPGTANGASSPDQNPPAVIGSSSNQSSTGIGSTSAGQNNSRTITNMRIPPLVKPISKGQKMSLCQCGQTDKLSACFGWNTTNSECDVDVSAFLLRENGKVVGDSWFVFYGQTASPDQSVILNTTANVDRETVSIDFTRLNREVKKIVFVLTIHKAFEKKLNFSMMKDAYVRILSGAGQSELVSFQMTEYYNNVISMMIGEIYQYKDSWKFNAIGNGVTRDLAGLCDLYGVETI